MTRIIPFLAAGMLLAGPAVAGAAAKQPIGLYTAVHGQVAVTHEGAARAESVKLHDQVHFRDLVETRQAARMRALLDDDTVLTLAENSRLEVSELVYTPADQRRTAVLRLLTGVVRSLVGRAFGAGSKFEIHTPTAVVAARGTYFVVWHTEQGGTGVANIGLKGDVEFSAGGRSVIVTPGLYSQAADGAAPSRPVSFEESALAREAVAATELQDSPRETAKDAVQAVGPLATAAPGLPSSGAVPVVTSAARLDSVTRLLGPLSVLAGTTTLLASPPAVISGMLTNSTATSSLNPVTARTAAR